MGGKIGGCPLFPEAIEDLLHTVESGDADTSAHALTQLAPDGETVGQVFSELMRIVESSSGEMNLSILHDACIGYHRWHSVVIKDKARGEAVLQWMSQKLWEMPSGPRKTALVRRYFDSVARLIDSGCLPAQPSLELALYTVAWDDILPGPLSSELFRLFSRYADAKAPELRDYVCRTCLSHPSPCFSTDEEGQQVLAFLRQARPDKDVPASIEAYHEFEMTHENRPCLDRAKYDSIATLPLPQSTEFPPETLRKYSGEAGAKYLLGYLLDHYDAAPELIDKTVESWIEKARGPYEYQIIGGCVESPAVYGAATNISHPIDLSERTVDIIVKGVARQSARGDLDSHSAFALRITLPQMLVALLKRDAGACSEENVRRQEWILHAQVESVLQWERRLQKVARISGESDDRHSYDQYSKSLRVDFPKNQGLYCIEAKQSLKDKARQLFESKSEYEDLPEPSRARIERMLQEILAIP